MPWLRLLRAWEALRVSMTPHRPVGSCSWQVVSAALRTRMQDSAPGPAGPKVEDLLAKLPSGDSQGWSHASRPRFIDSHRQPKVSIDTMATRTRRLIAALSIAALVAPLIAATGAFAQDPACCPDRPPLERAEDTAPCHGTPLLTCCDDVATAPEGKRVQPNKLPLVALALPTFAASVGASPARLVPLPDDLRWRASPLRLSVVLRV